MLDVHGHVSEGSGENLFVVRDNIIYTAPLAASILNGITRDAVVTLAREMGYEVREILMPREFLLIADEVMSGFGRCGKRKHPSPCRRSRRPTHPGHAGS